MAHSALERGVLNFFFFRVMNLVSQLAKIEIAQQKKEESEKAKVLSRIF